jgi:hypothetical protein
MKAVLSTKCDLIYELTTTKQRDSSYRTEIIPVLPIAGQKFPLYIAEGTWNFSRYFKVYLFTYYFEFKTHLFFSHFSEPKISVRLIFEVLFFTLGKSRKYRFPRSTSSLAKKKNSKFYGQ